MKQAHKVGADVALVARRVVEGIAAGVKESGGNAAESARATVQVALLTASDLGKIALHAVKQILAGAAEGLEEIAKARAATAAPAARQAPATAPAARTAKAAKVAPAAPPAARKRAAAPARARPARAT
jgi:hypothetical protein